MRVLRVACIQLTGGADRAQNVEAAGRLVARAAADGAELVVLPERWECVGGAAELHAAAERFDETVDAMRRWAREYALWLVGGSVSEPSGERLRNTTLVFSPDGDDVARYAKVHLFDVEVPGGIVYRESASDDAGAEAVAFAGPAGVVVGLTICYDLRFPELFRALADRGAELIVCPSSFTAVTGAAHWHVLLRARAIENGCYVAAAAQAGEVAPGRPAYGHALVVDPWGEVLVEAPGGGRRSFAPTSTARACSRCVSVCRRSRTGGRTCTGDPRGRLRRRLHARATWPRSGARGLPAAG